MASILDKATNRAISYVEDKVVDAVGDVKALDNFFIQAEKDCINKAKQNNMFESLSKGFGLNKIASGLQDFFSNKLVSSLNASPLRKMAEDILAENINKYSRTLSQNMLSIIPTQFTNTLKDIRALAFSATYSTLTLQPNMALFFTAKIAEEAIKAIADKRHTLLVMRDATVRLHNALLMMTGGGPFFDKYLEQLKEALRHLTQAQNQISAVEANFYINNIFLAPKFNEAKSLLDEAYALMLPANDDRPTQPDVDLLTKLLNGVLRTPDYKTQLTMLVTVPKFSMELLGSYDLYAIKVIKLNTLITGFETALQNISLASQGHNKDLIMQQLNNARKGLEDIVGTMNTELYGGKNYSGVEFIPNAASTSAKAVTWAIRTKAISVMLEIIDPQAATSVQITNEALLTYNLTIQDLELLNDRQSGVSVLHANAGREAVGDIEGLVLAMAFQANQAILSSSMVGKTKWDPRSVLALGKRLVERLDLSVQFDREVELVLSRFIHVNQRAISQQRMLGDSIFNLLDDLGMDRASDFLKKGAFGEFFKMTGTTATYIGAAITGLSLLQKGLTDQTKKNCIEQAKVSLESADSATKINAQINMQSSFPKQQNLNDKACTEGQQQASKVRACGSGIDASELFSNPLKSLQGAFTGVFGGDVTDTLKSSFGVFGEFTTTGVGNMPGQAVAILKKTAGIFTSSRFMASAIKEASVFAGNLTAGAVKAVNDAKAAASGAVSSVTGAVNGALGEVTDAMDDVLGDVEDVLGDFTDDLQDMASDSLGTVLGKSGKLSGALDDLVGNTLDSTQKALMVSAGIQVEQAADAQKELQSLLAQNKLIDNPFKNAETTMTPG